MTRGAVYLAGFKTPSTIVVAMPSVLLALTLAYTWRYVTHYTVQFGTVTTVTLAHLFIELLIS